MSLQLADVLSCELPQYFLTMIIVNLLQISNSEYSISIKICLWPAVVLPRTLGLLTANFVHKADINCRDVKWRENYNHL